MANEGEAAANATAVAKTVAISLVIESPPSRDVRPSSAGGKRHSFANLLNGLIDQPECALAVTALVRRRRRELSAEG
jgi:hypothetical protein